MGAMSVMRTPNRDGVLAAARSIAQILPPTPLLPVEIGGVRCWIKAESLQPIGAFKIRGGWWRLSCLSDEERARGVVAVSSGNHAQGVAWAAKKLGIKAAIVMPRNAPKVKLEATKALGAEIILYDRAPKDQGGEDRDEVAAREIDKRGAVLVHAFADAWVIEGQGSAGIEFTDQLGKQPPMILACCGGGGLTAGLALACPDSKVVPVEPEGWDMVGQALAKGEIVQVAPDAPETICDALQPPATQQINLDALRGRAQPGVTVTDDEVRNAQRFAFAKLGLAAEPGGSAALAAGLAGKLALKPDTVIMLTGRNVDPAPDAA